MSVLESGTSITAISATFIHNGNGRVIIHLETQMSKRCFLDSGVFFYKIGGRTLCKSCEISNITTGNIFQQQVHNSILPSSTQRREYRQGNASHLLLKRIRLWFQHWEPRKYISLKPPDFIAKQIMWCVFTHIPCEPTQLHSTAQYAS